MATVEQTHRPDRDRRPTVSENLSFVYSEARLIECFNQSGVQYLDIDPEMAPVLRLDAETAWQTLEIGLYCRFVHLRPSGGGARFLPIAGKAGAAPPLAVPPSLPPSLPSFVRPSVRPSIRLSIRPPHSKKLHVFSRPSVHSLSQLVFTSVSSLSRQLQSEQGRLCLGREAPAAATATALRRDGRSDAAKAEGPFTR